MSAFVPWGRSQIAFLKSAEVLESCTGQLYFWTFTWKEKDLPIPEYRRTWNRFTVALRRRLPLGFKALRVWERHPGGHGLHVHMLSTIRMDLGMVRLLLERAGMGIVCHVAKAQTGCAKYLAKYLTKQGRIRGVKQWSKLGKWQHVLCGSIVFKSKEADFFRNIYHSPEVQELPPRQRWWRTKVLHSVALAKMETMKGMAVPRDAKGVTDDLLPF
jgi:hypothetical protein